MTEQRALTVTEAMTRAKSALEGVRVRVVGEVSEFNDKPGYKAAYFTVSRRRRVDAVPDVARRLRRERRRAALRHARRARGQLLGVRAEGPDAVHGAHA